MTNFKPHRSYSNLKLATLTGQDHEVNMRNAASATIVKKSFVAL